MASVLIPAGSAWSPFADDVVLTRPFAGERALRTDNGATSLGASLTINGNIGSWQTNVGFNYSRNWANNLLENGVDVARSEEHTSELQSLMRISYAVFCLKKKKKNTQILTLHKAPNQDNLTI